MRTRRLISASLLLLQALTLQHVALSSHAFDDSGVAYEHETLAADSHADSEGHVCADVAVNEESAESCAVMASCLTPAVVQPVGLSLSWSQHVEGLAAVSFDGAMQVPLLALAPKLSPPLS